MTSNRHVTREDFSFPHHQPLPYFFIKIRRQMIFCLYVIMHLFEQRWVEWTLHVATKSQAKNHPP